MHGTPKENVAFGIDVLCLLVNVDILDITFQNRKAGRALGQASQTNRTYRLLSL